MTIVLILTSTTICSFGCKTQNADRGPVFAPVERTLAQSGPVKEDLIKRRLVILATTDTKGNPVPGEIKMGEIQKLVDEGVYAIDKQGYLVFGSSYTPSP
jgi:hypothetical protein